MPLGWERINVNKSVPNKNIVFVKPLPGPDEKTSQEFLERIAAQCLPIMNKHRLAVVSLEEYEPNREFWGRNFNNGEVVQLVLKSVSGQFLPFKFVQMIMIHELAHNKQMNHSKQFWSLRNEFSAEMRALWDKGYTGEGLWGRGKLLQNGVFARENLDEDLLPQQLCGGGFRSRGQKRKLKPKISYKQRKERRINRKFGPNGFILGADEEIKAKLEKGQKAVGKPKVAVSARGRNLRAAAALARFQVKKKVEELETHGEDLVTDSETEDDTAEDPFVQAEAGDDAMDLDGKRLLNAKGQGMVRVCEEEEADSEDVQQELSELRAINGPTKHARSSISFDKPDIAPSASEQSMEQQISPLPPEKLTKAGPFKNRRIDFRDTNLQSCSVCSSENEHSALTCCICSNVLQVDFVPNSWRCKSLTCKDSKYVNAGDVGLCGVCGTRKYSAELS